MSTNQIHQPQILPNNRHAKRTTNAQWNSRLVLTHSSLIYVADKRCTRSLSSQHISEQCPPKLTCTQPNSRLGICHIIPFFNKQLLSHKYDSMHKGRKVFKACNDRLR